MRLRQARGSRAPRSATGVIRLRSGRRPLEAEVAVRRHPMVGMRVESLAASRPAGRHDRSTCRGGALDTGRPRYAHCLADHAKLRGPGDGYGPYPVSHSALLPNPPERRQGEAVQPLVASPPSPPRPGPSTERPGWMGRARAAGRTSSGWPPQQRGASFAQILMTSTLGMKS